MLAPRSAKALHEKALLKLHGMRKLPGSPSFGGTLHLLEIRFHVGKRLGFLRGVGRKELGEKSANESDSEEFVNVFVRIGFGSTIELVSFDENQVVTFNGKFVCDFRNGDCKTGSQSDNTVGSPHEFIIHAIEVLKGNEKVTKITDVKNWWIDSSRILRGVVSLIEWNSSVSSTKSSIQSTFRFRTALKSPIEIDDNNFKIDLIPIMLGVFDIVIDMDWLDKYDANILCSQKHVRVINSQGREIIIYGDRRKGDLKLCSVMKARRYLSRGCYAFIAHVIDTNFEKKSVEDVSVVNEFLDVFPEELSGIPPERQVEFRIDLVPGATPTAKTPYHLAPSEMKELMSQL
ncbi:hypothetical protein Tco_0397558 [Tanacetum coccineum]